MRPIQPSAFQYLLPQLVQSGDNTQTSGSNGWTPGGGFSLQIPDNTIIGGNPRGLGAVDLQTQRTAAIQVASGAGSFVMGVNNRASGTQAVAIGSSSIASNSYTFAMGLNNTASGTQSVALGLNNIVSATNSFAMGSGNVASGNQSVAMGGSSGASASYSTAMGLSTAGSAYTAATGASSASGTGASAMGTSTASNTCATAVGQSSAQGSFSFASGYSLAAQIGKFTHSGTVFSTTGDSQTGMLVVRASTTTNTTVVLTSDGTGAGTTNQLIASTDRAMAFTGELIGKQSGSANIAAYKIEGTLVNNAGTVTMPTGTLTAIGTDSIGLNTAPTLAADNTNKGLTVTSGAKTTTNIRWVCTLRSTEVVYA